MSNNANRFVTIAHKRRQAAEDARYVRPCDKVGGAGKHLMKEARRAARTGEQIQKLLQRAEGLRLREEYKGVIPPNFHASLYPNICTMLNDGGKYVVASYVTAPEKGCCSPSNALSELEEFLSCHNGMSWWKIPRSSWRAHRWYVSNVRSTVHATPKFWEQLGKISANVRWVAISLPPTRLRSVEVIDGWKDYSTKLPWSHRDLKWTEVQKASRGMRAAAQYVPEWRSAVVWNWRFHNTFPTDWPTGHWPWNFGPGLEGLVAAASSRDPWLRRGSQLDAACRLCYWLGDLNTAEALWRRLGIDHVVPTFTPQALHDLAQRFPLRPAPKWWRSIIMAAPAQARPYLRVADRIEAAVKAGEPPPKSIMDIRNICEKCGIVVPTAGDLTEEEEEFVNSNPAKLWEELPNVDTIVGSVHLTKVAHNDPLLVTAGRLVDCCQHLDGAASSAAEAAWVNPACGVYVAKKGNIVVGQAFAWRGQAGWDDTGDDILVLDSIECLDGHEESVAKAFVTAAPMLLHPGLGVRKVVVGVTRYGCTDRVLESARRESVAAPTMPYSGYTDADQVQMLAKITKNGKVRTYSKCEEVEQEG